MKLSPFIRNALRSFGLRQSELAPPRPKNPRRVEGGKKAAETRRRNKEIAQVTAERDALRQEAEAVYARYCAEHGIDLNALDEVSP